ncbi:unnamed protein product [Hanseniaspora opuntiae]
MTEDSKKQLIARNAIYHKEPQDLKAFKRTVQNLSVSIDVGDNELVMPPHIEDQQRMFQDKPTTNIKTQNFNIQQSKAWLTPSSAIALSGALAGFLSGVVVCPLDVAKTRLQVQSFYYKQKDTTSLKYKGIFNTLRTIVAEEGVRGLYNGLAPISLGYFPTWMIYFSVYEYCKQNKNSPFINIKSNYGNHALSAITAGLISSTLTNPIWVVKTRLMLQVNQKTSVVVQSIDAQPLKHTNTSIETTRYNGTFDCFKKMYKEEGLKSFYSGLTPTLFGVVHVAIHFPLYEYCKNHIFKIDNRSENNFQNLFLSSCISKMIATAITYPHEIVRTNLQIKDGKGKTLLGVVKYVYNGYGQSHLQGIYKIGNFYKGFGANLVRTVPASMITLISFEYFKNYLCAFTNTS